MDDIELNPRVIALKALVEDQAREIHKMYRHKDYTMGQYSFEDCCIRWCKDARAELQD